MYTCRFLNTPQCLWFDDDVYPKLGIGIYKCDKRRNAPMEKTMIINVQWDGNVLRNGEKVVGYVGQVIINDRTIYLANYVTIDIMQGN